MSKIRVLQVIPSLNSAGAERVVVNLTTHLDRQRFEVAAVSLGEARGSALEQRLAQEGLQVWYLGKRAGLDPRIPFRLRKVVRQFRPHLLHSHLCLHYTLPPVVPQSVAQVSTSHLAGPTLFWWIIKWVNRWAYWRGVIPVAVSRDVANWENRTARLQDCLVIPNGIPISDFQLSAGVRRSWREKQGFTEEDVLFVCVARLEEQKNHAMLLEAFARGPSLTPNTHLLLVGEGTLRATLELQSRQLNLQGKVHFLGCRSDVSEILRAADVFVLSSHNEGNPMALMEAMAAGLPTVATAVGGISELVTHENAGLLVNPGDCNAMAAAMVRLLQNASLRQAMAASAARHAAHTFSASRMAQAYMQLYERMLAEKISAQPSSREMVIDYPN